MFVLVTNMRQTISILKGEPNIWKQLFHCRQQRYAGFRDYINGYANVSLFFSRHPGNAHFSQLAGHQYHLSERWKEKQDLSGKQGHRHMDH